MKFLGTIFLMLPNDIGDSNIVVDTNHPSILQIYQIMVDKEIPALHFKPVDENFVKKQINSIVSLALLYILNITCQNLYHMLYQLENPISPQGPPARGVI